MKDVLVLLGSESDREQVDPGLKLLDEKKLSFIVFDPSICRIQID